MQTSVRKRRYHEDLFDVGVDDLKLFDLNMVVKILKTRT